MPILFNRLYLTGRELEYIQQSIKNGQITGNAEYAHKCESLLQTAFNAKRLLLTNSCTHALEMACLLINLEPGDEVIVPSYTFPSTVNSFILRGAKPVFVDMREDTLNIDEGKIEEKITNKTKAIFPVHYAGIACEMNVIMKIARRYNLFVVEDAAQGVNAKYNDRYLGTIGDLGTYSFHGTKNYTCGEGGAIVINNDEFLERAEIIREKGTNKNKFSRGEISKYTWVDIGSSSLLSDILAAFLYAQLERLDEITEKRKDIFEFYYQNLRELEIAKQLRLPIIPEKCNPNYHLFHIILNSEYQRNNLMEYLKQQAIQAVFHYIPLHITPMGKKFGYKEGDLPTTESLSARLLRLPFHPHLTKEELKLVVGKIKDFFVKK